MSHPWTLIVKRSRSKRESENRSGHQRIFFVMLLSLVCPSVQENEPRNLLCNAFLLMLYEINLNNYAKAFITVKRCFVRILAAMLIMPSHYVHNSSGSYAMMFCSPEHNGPQVTASSRDVAHPRAQVSTCSADFDG